MKSLFFKLLLAVASVAITLLAMEGVARVERMFRGAGKEAAEVHAIPRIRSGARLEAHTQHPRHLSAS